MLRDDSNAKFWHARGLCFQEEAEYISRKFGSAERELEEEKIDQAISYFMTSVQLCDTFAASMFHLGLLFRRKGLFREALQQYTKVQVLMPDDPSNYIQRGLVY